MPDSVIHVTELIIVTLVAFVALLAAFTQRLKLPYPIVLVLGGLVLSVVPVFPNISLRPDFIFLVILPPLLFSSALQTSWSGFRYNLVSISMLAFGLVGFTVAGVAIAAHLFLPGFDWRAGAVLGAVVCTTDAIAIAAIAKRIGLPEILLEIIEGESLLNDATGLLALEFSVAIVVSGTIPSVGHGIGQLGVLVAGGILSGLLVGGIIQFFQRPVQGSALQTMVSVATPYFAYLLGEGIHTSGVLATVSCGLYLGRQSSKTFTSEARLDSQAVWNTIEFVLNGFVFILIGLQLPTVLPRMRQYSWPQLIGTAAFVSLLLIALRMIWIFPGARIAWWIRTRVFKQKMIRIDNGQLIVLGWSGLRGVLTLAAALSLPETTDAGAPFPQRDIILFIAFAVILVTLVGQGLTLPYLTRKLGVCQSTDISDEESDARRALLTAALKKIETMEDDAGGAEAHQSTVDALGRSYRQRLELIQREEESGKDSMFKKGRPDPRLYMRLASAARQAERDELVRLRAEGEIGDGTVRRLERELDLLDLRFPSA